MILPREPGDDSESDLLVNPYRVADDCIFAACPGGWESAAHAFSLRAGGQWFFSEVGLTWKNGSRCLWVRDHSARADLMEARLACSDLGVSPGWSLGRCARNILAWIGDPQPFSYRLDYIHDDAGTGFRCLRPGHYEDVVVWDAKAYYYTMFRRLPSLRCSPATDGTIGWQAMYKDEVARRRRAEERIGDCKGLRNALWGAALGSTVKRAFYHRGERKPFVGRRGPFHAAALVLARAAWELTREAAEEVDSVYSHTDCVTSRGGLFPSVWEASGYEVAVKDAGSADFHNLMNFRIGSRSSRYFDPQGLWLEEIAIPARPRLAYGRHWAYVA